MALSVSKQRTYRASMELRKSVPYTLHSFNRRPKASTLSRTHFAITLFYGPLLELGLKHSFVGCFRATL